MASQILSSFLKSLTLMTLADVVVTEMSGVLAEVVGEVEHLHFHSHFCSNLELFFSSSWVSTSFLSQS